MALIERTNAEALIPEGEVQDIFKSVAETSVAMQLLTRLPNMTSNKTRIKVEESLPLVYWQAGDTAFKKTTTMKWKNKYLYAEEIAVIIPISEAVLEDAEYDIWGEVKPKIVEAISATFDSAVFFGTNKPANFPEGIVTQASTKGFSLEQGDLNLYGVLNELMGKVETAGYDVTGVVGGPSVKKDFRNLLDKNGQLIVGDEISALPRYIMKNGAWKNDEARLILGDFKEGVFALRQDVTYKLLTEGVIQDPDSKEILYNLAQQDMVALRVVFRIGWQLPNPVNALAPNEEARLPFAILEPNA